MHSLRWRYNNLRRIPFTVYCVHHQPHVYSVQIRDLRGYRYTKWWARHAAILRECTEHRRA